MTSPKLRRETLQNGFTSRFKGAKSKTFKLYDDDPDAVEWMLQWIYDIDLTRSADTSRENFRLYSNLWAVSGKYQLPGLMDHVAEIVEQYFSHVSLDAALLAKYEARITALVEKYQLDEFETRTTCGACRQKTEQPQLTSCLHVFCVHCLHDLQHHAALRGRDCATCCQCGHKYTRVVSCNIGEGEHNLIDDMIFALRCIYQEAPAHDGRLRRMAAASCCKHLPYLISKPAFADFLLEASELAVDVIKVVGGEA